MFRKFAVDAINEAVDAGIKTIIVVTEGISVYDIKIYDKVEKKGIRLLGQIPCEHADSWFGFYLELSSTYNVAMLVWFRGLGY
ncbi:MAG: hypothetical protein R2883_02620 [Caldisericia bacterium]